MHDGDVTSSIPFGATAANDVAIAQAHLRSRRQAKPALGRMLVVVVALDQEFAGEGQRAAPELGTLRMIRCEALLARALGEIVDHEPDRAEHRDAARRARIEVLPHERFELGHDRCVGHEEGIGVDVRPVLERNRMRAELHEMAANGDPVAFREPLLRDGARSNAHRGFARRRAAAAAIVADAVLLPVRIVGMRLLRKSI